VIVETGFTDREAWRMAKTPLVNRVGRTGDLRNRDA